MSTALFRIPVGVLAEQHKPRSIWLDDLWSPVSVFTGWASAQPWTRVSASAGKQLFFAGNAVIELHRTETANYRDNLASGTPSVWVVLRPSRSVPPYAIFSVTADPAEGEALAGCGDDLVAAVPMPEAIAVIVGAFVAEHHAERPFTRRERAGWVPHERA
jgi:hypothetical protein